MRGPLGFSVLRFWPFGLWVFLLFTFGFPFSAEIQADGFLDLVFIVVFGFSNSVSCSKCKFDIGSGPGGQGSTAPPPQTKIWWAQPPTFWCRKYRHCSVKLVC